MRKINNGIIYEDDINNTVWPNLDSNTWLQIDTTSDQNLCRRARLIASNEHSDKTVIWTDNYDPDSVLGMIAWREADNLFYYIVEIVVNTDYQQLGIGYFLGIAISSVMAEMGITLSPPMTTGWPWRAEAGEKMIAKWAIDYEIDWIEFLWEDGKYYKFSDLVELGVLERKYPN